jgi:tRNA A-37 threonylcarbamoyl transferase component Bud32
MSPYEPGTVLNGRYRLHNVVARGGLGVVYAADDLGLFSRRVAIKILGSSAQKDRYRREIQALSSIRHPSIAAGYDWGTTDSGDLFLVQELINGSQLCDIVPKGGLEPIRTAGLARTFGGGLSAVHDAGIIHRDINPMNLMITNLNMPNETPVLIDFGMAEFPGDVRGPAGGVVGYVAPEALTSLTPVEKEADIFSFAATMYFALTGQTPYDDPSELFGKGLNDRIHAVAQTLPASAVGVLLKGLALHPGDRYHIASQFGNDLCNALQRGTFLADVPPRPLRVFLCHASVDKDRVRELYQLLVAKHVDAWLDEEKLLPGQEWQLEIAAAVRSSDAIVVCLSEAAISREGFVQKEVRWALDVAEEKPDGTIFIIPVRLEDCTVPIRLRAWQWVDIFDDRGVVRLLEALQARAAHITRRARPEHRTGIGRNMK